MNLTFNETLFLIIKTRNHSNFHNMKNLLGIIVIIVLAIFLLPIILSIIKFILMLIVNSILYVIFIVIIAVVFMFTGHLLNKNNEIIVLSNTYEISINRYLKKFIYL